MTNGKFLAPGSLNEPMGFALENSFGKGCGLAESQKNICLNRRSSCTSENLYVRSFWWRYLHSDGEGPGTMPAVLFISTRISRKVGRMGKELRHSPEEILVLRAIHFCQSTLSLWLQSDQMNVNREAIGCKDSGSVSLMSSMHLIRNLIFSPISSLWQPWSQMQEQIFSKLNQPDDSVLILFYWLVLRS